MQDFRIERIEIQGFRGLQRRLDLHLVDPAGNPVDQFIVAGVNGSGKTSLLEGVLLGVGAGALIVRDLADAEQQTCLRTHLPEGAAIDLVIQMRDSTAPDQPWSACRSRCRSGGQMWGEVTGSGEDEVSVWESLSGALAQRVEYFSSWRSPALVGGVRPSTGGSTVDRRESSRLRVLKQKIVNQRARKAFGEASRENLWLERINQAWLTFHGNDRTRIEALIVNPDAEDTAFDLFVVEGDKRVCSIDEVSSGELELVTIAGTLALQHDLSLIVIDEPELHLHPDWQGRLIPAIRELAPRAQILAATHADEPWDRVKSWERAFLASPGDPRIVRADAP